MTHTSLLQPDRVRNYRLLTQRWTRLVKAWPFLKLRVFGEAGGYPLLLVESERKFGGTRSLYLSAGIHGDEPAPVEGLFQWASMAIPDLADWNLQIFPCLNPWGLERNIRFDDAGRDLNRCFNSRTVPQIRAQIDAMKGWHYDMAVTLHEDYDARGFYLYEVAAERPHWGEGLRDDLSEGMIPDPRRRIDGHHARRGVIRRRIRPAMIKGHPESFRLHFQHARRTFTFETPSEDFLVRRVEIHRKFLELVLGKLKTSDSSKKKLP